MVPSYSDAGVRDHGVVSSRKRRNRPPNRDATRRARDAHTQRAHAAQPAGGPEDQPLIQSLRAGLRADDPTEFLIQASAVLEGAGDSAAALLESFMAINIAETTSALHVFLPYLNDEAQAAARHTLAQRRQPVPPTVTGLIDARVDEAYFMGDELGDGDNVILGARWPDGWQCTVIVYIDHNMGTIVKDAFFRGEPAPTVVGYYNNLLDQEQESQRPMPLDLADARARVEQALAAWDISDADIETDQWPMCRMLIGLLASTMPEGGEAYDAARVPVDVASVVDGFFASTEAEGLDRHGPDGEAAAALLTFAGERGDPLRWSPVSVEVACVDGPVWDETVSDDAVYAIGSVLPRLVRYSHRELRITPAATSHTLDSVDRWVPAMETLIEHPSRVDLRVTEALLDQVEAGDMSGYIARLLGDHLGSTEAVAALDATPLPDEALELDGVEPDLYDLMHEVDGLIGTAIADSPWPELNGEVRTACRRFLTQVARNDPKVLRRRAKPANTAAAVLVLIGRANDLMGANRPVPVKGVLQHLGLSAAAAPTQRMDTLVAAFGGPRSLVGVALGSPQVLTGARRAQLLRWRDTGSFD